VVRTTRSKKKERKGEGLAERRKARLSIKVSKMIKQLNIKAHIDQGLTTVRRARMGDIGPKWTNDSASTKQRGTGWTRGLSKVNRQERNTRNTENGEYTGTTEKRLGERRRARKGRLLRQDTTSNG